jgi:acyl-CoA reductase-like NAD-dependent aldehyde dehydrogenase
MRIAHEEVFGPVLPIFPYSDIGNAIAYVNARPWPLQEGGWKTREPIFPHAI